MTIRNIDERLKGRLRVQAARHGRLMEEEARDILRSALSTERSRIGSLVDFICARLYSPLPSLGAKFSTAFDCFQTSNCAEDCGMPRKRFLTRILLTRC